jgi:hypothetical protein
MMYEKNLGAFFRMMYEKNMADATRNQVFLTIW